MLIPYGLCGSVLMVSWACKVVIHFKELARCLARAYNGLPDKELQTFTYGNAFELLSLLRVGVLGAAFQNRLHVRA